MTKTLLIAFAVAAAVFLALSFLFELPPLAFGWLYFLLHNIRRVSINPIAIISGAVFIAISIAAIHGCGASLGSALTAKSGLPRRWRFRWTVAVLAGVFLMFVIALSTVGLARHLGWLFSDKQPTYEERVSYISED